MYVQNGDRPRWAWSGQHVEVAAAWEAVPTGQGPGDDLALPEVELVGEAVQRPSWAWGDGVSAEPVAASVAAAPVPEVVVGDRPAWSWGGADG